MQTAEIRTFTPDEAEYLLANHNNKNRRLSNTRAKSLADAMKKGQWKLNGETIVFGLSGNVMTGQHRLRACVIAGLPLTTWVVSNVPDEYFATMDQGAKKTAGEILGIDGETNSNYLAAVARWVHMIEAGGNLSKRVSPQDTKETVAAHPGLREWVLRVRSSSGPQRRLFQAPVLAPIVMAAEKYGHQFAADFFDKVQTGEGLHRNDPPYLLRERLLGARSSSVILPAVQAALTIKALALAVRGKKATFVRWSADEAFPVLP